MSGGPLGVVGRLFSDIRSLDELLYRAIVDIHLHLHRQSLLFTHVARALLPGGSGLGSTLLLMVAVRAAASVFSLVMDAFDRHAALSEQPSLPQSALLARRASRSGTGIFRIAMSLLEDDELNLPDELLDEDGMDELGGDGAQFNNDPM